MADSEDCPRIASGESSGSVMSVQSAELSASCTRTSHHETSLLSPETLVPLPVKSLMSSFNSLHDPAVLIERLEMSGEKKRKVDIPGLDGATIDGEEPLDMIVAKCQFSEMLARYRHVEGRYSSWLMAFSSNAHASGRDLSFPNTFPIKLVTNYREAWDRCCFYYADEEERAVQWNNLLLLIRAGAEEDTEEYMKLAAIHELAYAHIVTEIFVILL